MAANTYVLMSATGDLIESKKPGELGANRRTRIYGRLDCPAALRNLRRGGYSSHRVFFADEPTARAAGFRPCATCMGEEYEAWRTARREAAGNPTGAP